VRIAFDIGGVLSKFPDVFRPLFDAVLAAEAFGKVEVWVVSDMKPHAKALAFCHDNNFWVRPERVVCADYQANGEACKAVVCEQLGIDVLVDDFIGYIATPGRPPVRLLVMPDPELPYYADDWKTDGSEGNFGRRNPPGSKRPPEDRGGATSIREPIP
jgi:hypothetical protein